jgi:hypothetical protein
MAKMANKIAKSIDNVATRFINMHKESSNFTSPAATKGKASTSAIGESVIKSTATKGKASTSAIGESVIKSAATTEKSNAAILKVVSSLGTNKNKYTPITTELRRIAETLGFISSKQLPLITEFMAKDNAQGMRAYALESKAFKKNNKMSKAANRMRRESVLESGTADSSSEKGGKKDTEVEEEMGIFGKLKGGLLGGLFMFKGLALNMLKIFGKAGVIGAVVMVVKGLYDKFQEGEFDTQIAELGTKWDKLMISLQPTIETLTTLFDVIFDHLITFVGEALMTVADGLMDVVGGLGKIFEGDISGGIKQLIMGKDGKGGIVNMLGNLVLDGFKAIGGILGDLGITEAFNTWLKDLIRPMLPEKDSMLAWAVPNALYEYVGEAPLVQNKQDKAIQNDAKSLIDTPEKQGKPLYTVKPYIEGTYNTTTKLEKPDIPDSVTAGTKANSMAKQESDNAKSTPSIVDASNVQNNKSTTQTINNLAAEPPRGEKNRQAMADYSMLAF